MLRTRSEGSKGGKGSAWLRLITIPLFLVHSSWYGIMCPVQWHNSPTTKAFYIFSTWLTESTGDTTKYTSYDTY